MICHNGVLPSYLSPTHRAHVMIIVKLLVALLAFGHPVPDSMALTWGWGVLFDTAKLIGDTPMVQRPNFILDSFSMGGFL